MGVSYGTHVALQYARAFPRARRPADPRLDRRPRRPRRASCSTPTATSRACCASSARTARCREHDAATRWPTWPRSSRRIRRERPAARRLRTTRSGKRRATQLLDAPTSCSFLLIARRPEPVPAGRTPGRAVERRARGDTGAAHAPARSRPGRPTTPVGDLSVGLNVDDRLHRRDAALPAADAGRRAPGRSPQQALAAIPPSSYDAVRRRRPCCARATSTTAWPGRRTPPRPPFTGPLPDVPALLLGGRLDTRTPLENARATAARAAARRRIVTRDGHRATTCSTATSPAARQPALRALHRRRQPVGQPVPGPGQRRRRRLPLPPRRAERLPLGARRRRHAAGARCSPCSTPSPMRAWPPLQALFAGVQVQRGRPARRQLLAARRASRAACACAATPSSPACASAGHCPPARGRSLAPKVNARAGPPTAR